MKPTILLLLLLNILSLSAQIITFPDPNFKAALVGAVIASNGAVDQNMNAIDLDANSDGEIQVSEAAAVYGLYLMMKPSITDISGIENFTNLQQLSMSDCSINTVDLSGMSTLQTINFSNNPLSFINLSGLTLLEQIGVDDCNLSSLDLSGLSSLVTLLCKNNQLTSIDFTDNPNLDFIDIADNSLTSLDISELRLIQSVLAANNQLTTIFMKNGHIDDVDYTNNLGLQYICEDDEYLASLQANLLAFGFVNVSANSYCSFTPGGDYNTFEGNYIFDADNNGCDINDQSILLNQKMEIMHNAEYNACFTNDVNEYVYFVDTGNFDLTIRLEDALAFTIAPPTISVGFPNDLNNLFTQDFCISPTGIHPDLEIVLSPLTDVIPGDITRYELLYKNKGNQILSGEASLAFNEDMIDYISSSVLPSSSLSGNLSWAFTDLLPFESIRIALEFYIHSSSDNPPVFVGNSFSFDTQIIPVWGDDTPLDNRFILEQHVIGSAIPNKILCLNGNQVTPQLLGEYLYFAISFENDGLGETTNVVVSETIDPAFLDIRSLEILSSSAPMYTRVKNDKIEHVFENMALTDHNHGNILMKFKCNPDAPLGDTISVPSTIYFDYDLPLKAIDGNNTYGNLTEGLSEEELDHSISVYPNPCHSLFTIQSTHEIKQIQVYDQMGRLVQTSLGIPTVKSVDLYRQLNGLYFIKVTTTVGISVLEMVKE